MTFSNRNGTRAAKTAKMLSELSDVSPYFAVGTGPVAEDGWRPVQQLYTDTRAPALLTSGLLTRDFAVSRTRSPGQPSLGQPRLPMLRPRRRRSGSNP